MKKLIAILVFALFGFSAPALAEPIGGQGNVNCAVTNCFGSEITLQWFEVTPTHYVVTLTVDTTFAAANLPAGAYIDTVAIKVSAGTNATGNLAFTSAAGLWNFELGGHGPGGDCSGTLNGFLCADTLSTANLVGAGNVYEWQFNVFDNDFITTFLGASVFVDYNAPGSTQGLQTSANITLQEGGPPLEVPEPHTLALLAIGLLGLGFVGRRRA